MRFKLAYPIVNNENAGFHFTQDWYIANACVGVQLASDLGDKQSGQEHSHAQSTDLLGAVSFEDVELGGENSIEDD